MEFRLEREKVSLVLISARRVLLRGVLSAAVLAAAAFVFSKKLILLLVQHVHVTLYYFNLSEVFFSSVEVAIYVGVFLSIPLVIVLIFREFREVFRGHITRGFLYVVFSVVLFYLGSVFCYLIVLPSGIGFLLSYEGGALKAMMSTERFVRFCVTMIFAFGAAFELPIVLLLLGKIGIVNYRMLSRTRRYALLIIVVAASVITPTPDIYNMSLLAVPLYALYEIGILLLRVGERSLTPKVDSV